MAVRRRVVVAEDADAGRIVARIPIAADSVVVCMLMGVGTVVRGVADAETGRFDDEDDDEEAMIGVVMGVFATMG